MQSNVIQLFPDTHAAHGGPVERAKAALNTVNRELARAAVQEESREAYALFETIAQALREE